MAVNSPSGDPKYSHPQQAMGVERSGRADPLEGRFVAMALGGEHSCALRADGGISCWGTDSHGQAEPPEGRFTAVVAGDRHSCGLRTDGTVAWWGRSWTLPPPDGVHEVRSSDDAAAPPVERS